MNRELQISAPVSSTTRDLLQQHVRATGVKKGYLIEQALLHHLRALQALPTEVIVPPRIVVSRKSGEQILKRVVAPPRPAARLKKLFQP